jgi:hypothetical protein
LEIGTLNQTVTFTFSKEQALNPETLKQLKEQIVGIREVIIRQILMRVH